MADDKTIMPAWPELLPSYMSVVQFPGWYRIIFTVVTASVFLIFAGLINKLRLRWWYLWALRKFPKHPNHTFLFGDLPEYSKGFAGMIQEYRMKREFLFNFQEEAMQFWLGPFMPGVVLYHPEACRAVLTKSEPKQEEIMRFLREWIGDGLVVSHGKKWQRNRNLVTPAFHNAGLRPYVSIFSKCAFVLVNKWKEMGKDGPVSIETFEHMNLLTLDNLMRSIYSLETNCQTTGVNDTSPYVIAVRRIIDLFFRRFVNPWLYSDFIYNMTENGKEFRKHMRTAQAFSASTVRKRRLQRLEGREGFGNRKRQFKDFLEILLDARDADGNGLSEVEIQNEVDTFTVGGYETTATCSSWALYCLAKYPIFQEKCREEVDEFMDRKGTDDIEWQDLHSLEYVGQFLRESQRVLPTVPFVLRRLTQPHTMDDGRVIPTDTTVYISMSGLHVNPSAWDHPEVFDPDRFSAENISRIPSHAFLPFSAGPRNCIGQHFAVNEVKTTLAILLRYFQILPDEARPISLINIGTLRSETGVHVIIKPREDRTF
ncbi:cytochrome P450 4X1-like [Amphiura filiformis]|uniref:cytochrome P450 4X1-like n=1 Tax=Amphiura filiformis TaxID=82378 RepID=UPI003B20C3B7